MQMFKSDWDEYQAIILAGGFGTRVKHLLGGLPKPMAQVNGAPFLHWVIKSLLMQGLKHVALSTHYQARLIEKFISNDFKDQNIKCIEEPSPQGTAGGVIFVKNALESQNSACKAKFLVLNGDSLIAGDFSRAAEMLADDIDCVILGVQTSNTDRYGRLIIDENYNLLSFEEKMSGAGIINAGVYLIRASVFEKYQGCKTPISFEYDIFPKMITDNKKIKVFLMKCPFIDIGTESSLANASQFVREYLNG
ncbi:sugar phosphate nucleotidyltransferase [Polynucleobacter sp. MWH-UH23A]|uniref:sugar phosphate nucleotidyltransferase n=1 Tax=Polynucleobacter sp. MWH-UH23A TaxID=1855613 RepID=UPI003364B50F